MILCRIHIYESVEILFNKADLRKTVERTRSLYSLICVSDNYSMVGQ